MAQLCSEGEFARTARRACWQCAEVMATCTQKAAFTVLRMGTHPSGPARLLAEEGTTLNAWLEAHPAALGGAVRQRFGGDLPFLFKVTPAGRPARLTALPVLRHSPLAAAGIGSVISFSACECSRRNASLWRWKPTRQWCRFQFV